MLSVGGEAEAGDGQASCRVAGAERQVHRANHCAQSRTRSCEQESARSERGEDRASEKHVQETGTGTNPDQPSGPGLL